MTAPVAFKVTPPMKKALDSAVKRSHGTLSGYMRSLLAPILKKT